MDEIQSYEFETIVEFVQMHKKKYCQHVSAIPTFRSKRKRKEQQSWS
jgi:hypothetical protein